MALVGLTVVIRQNNSAGRWSQGLLDAHVGMIAEAEGDSTPLGHRPLCVLPVVYHIWASVRLAHVQELFCAWVLDSVFSAGQGVCSVEAWYSISIDIEQSSQQCSARRLPYLRC